MITRLPSLSLLRPLLLPLLLRLMPLVWLALMALPFGARAAAATPPCHQHAQAQAAAVHAAVRLAAQHPSCALHAQGQGRDPGHAAGHDHAHCTSCPACCAGVAPAPAQPMAPSDAGPAFVAIPFRAGHVPSVDPSLPERPPRASFA